MNAQQNPTGELVLYQTDDGDTRLQVRLIEGSLWMTQRQMAVLFQKDVRTVSEHLKNVYQDGELAADRTIRKFRIVATEATRSVERLVDHYHLDAIFQVGFRVRSHRGAQFRKWATEHLKTYLTQGFLLDDERFKSGKDEEYFETLLARIRDIRSSEKVFWKKVLDIYATSIDYDPKIETSQQFFATVQNKMHWAAHGHTAAEVIALRANASAPSMGLTSWVGQAKGGLIRKSDIGVAKNYLTEEELASLNRMVTAYIEVAQIQAQARVAMSMRDWAARLDDFLRMTMKDVLTHAGKVSAEVAQLKANAAFDIYHAEQVNAPSQVERDFEAALEQSMKRLEKK